MRTAKSNLAGWSEVSHHAGAPGPVHVHVICLPDWQPLSAYSHITAPDGTLPAPIALGAGRGSVESTGRAAPNILLGHRVVGLVDA